jgi:hypothetical protein
METEEEFLHKLSELMTGTMLGSATLRWSVEGVLEDKVDIESLAIKLQENLEALVELVENRRRQVKES